MQKTKEQFIHIGGLGEEIAGPGGDCIVKEFTAKALTGPATKIAGLPMVVIYENPVDYPDKFAGRIYIVGTKMISKSWQIIIADTLEELKRKIKKKPLMVMPRNEDDALAIKEIWLF